MYKITNLWNRLIRSSESGENNGKTQPCFHTFKTCLKQIRNSRYREFIIVLMFSQKRKAFHGIIFREKSFTTTFRKPSKLFVNLWTFICFFLFRKCIMALTVWSRWSLTHCMVLIITSTNIGLSVNLPVTKLLAGIQPQLFASTYKELASIIKLKPRTFKQYYCTTVNIHASLQARKLEPTLFSEHHRF